MFKVKALSMIGLIIILFGFIGCQNYESEEIYIVPHSINTKAYERGNASTTFYFVSNKDISTVNELSINFKYDLFSVLRDYSMSEFTKVEKYQDYYIYRVHVDIMGLDGGLDIYEILFESESGISYSFNTNVYISSDYEKENHIYGGVSDDNTGVSFTYFNYKNGMEIPLLPRESITIEDIYFEGKESMDLTDYIQTIIINNKVLDEERFIDSEEVFTLKIEFNSLDEWHGYIVDILVASYIDDNEELSTAYILIPLYLGHPVSASREYIDSTWY